MTPKNSIAREDCEYILRAKVTTDVWRLGNRVEIEVDGKSEIIRSFGKKTCRAATYRPYVIGAGPIR